MIANRVLVAHVTVPKQGITELTPPMLKVVRDNLTRHSAKDLLMNASRQAGYDGSRVLHELSQASLVVPEEIEARLKLAKEQQATLDVRCWVGRLVLGVDCSCSEARQVDGVPQVNHLLRSPALLERKDFLEQVFVGIVPMRAADSHEAPPAPRDGCHVLLPSLGGLSLALDAVRDCKRLLLRLPSSKFSFHV
jgi:hypothetical protein